MILAPDRTIGGEKRWHAIGAVQHALALVVDLYHGAKRNGGVYPRHPHSIQIGDKDTGPGANRGTGNVELGRCAAALE